MQQQQWGRGWHVSTRVPAPCVSICCIHLPFICLIVEAATWIVRDCRVREMIFLSLVSVICLC